ARTSPAARATRDAGDAPTDMAATDGAPAASPAPALQAAAVAAPAGDLRCRVRLADEGLARGSWRPRKPAQPTEPKPFDFEACVKKLNSVRSSYYFDKDRLGKFIPVRLSKEEAWFWLNILDLPHHEPGALEEWLRVAQAAWPAEDEDVRAWAQE